MRRLLALAFVLAMAAPASAAKPDLVVASGSLSAQGDRVTGAVTFRNAGNAAARKSQAALTARVPGRPRFVAEITVRRMAPGATRLAEVSARAPDALPSGSFALRVCADAMRKVAERSERNNCRRVGTLGAPATPGPDGDTTPTDPIDFPEDKPFERRSPESPYWAYVPSSYDASHATPTTLFVWMHGCGGDSGGDIFTVAPQGRTYIAVSLGGRDGQCWNMEEDQAKVLAAIADVQTHFNVDRRRVVLGGYSSGGDLAYRTAFYNADRFAGVLAENTSPFRDTGSTQQQSIAAASWKFHVVHLAHTGDTTYPIAGVRKEVQALKDAGFPAQLIERPGEHYDANTDADLQELLLPRLDDGWLAPAR